jgi:hypothetical protein
VDDFCNKPGYTGFGNNGSVYDYFLEISGGALVPFDAEYMLLCI